MIKTSNNQHKIKSLQGLRAIGFLCICSGHCTFTKLGAFGVSIFFILSGFLLVNRNIDNDIPHTISNCLRYSYNKIKKLYPLHILTMIAIIFYLKKTQDIIQWEMIFANIFLIQSWIPDMAAYFSLNGVAWYLSVCTFIYAMFPPILSFIRKTGKHSFLFIGVIYLFQLLIGVGAEYLASIDIFKVPDLIHWTTYICPIFRIGDFIIGGYLGYIFAHKKFVNIKPYVVSTVELISIIALIVIQYLLGNNVSIWGLEFFKNTLGYTPIVAVLVIVFALEKGIVSKCLSWRPLVYLGNISAYTFLIHCAVIPYLRTLLDVLNYTVNSLVLFLLTFVITCICSEIYIRLEACKRIKK